MFLVKINDLSLKKIQTIFCRYEKYQLFELMKNFRPAKKKIHVNGLIVMHDKQFFAICMCELNPMGLARADVKRYVME